MGLRILSYLILLTYLGCAHQTSMSDPKLSLLWKGYAVSDELITKAKEEWPRDKTLLDMQEGLDLLRRGKLTLEEIKRAQSYLESAYNTFEDLKDPENFSKAFTPDNQTPYRGRPYERMLTAILLGLIDSTHQRCDIALPAFKAAEFLDARWQAFMFGSDAPLIYAMTLRCQLEIKAPESDLKRSREGLYQALRLQLLLEPLLEFVASQAKLQDKTPARQIALSLLEVGLPSALLVASADSDLKKILEVASAESMRFFSKAMKEKEEPYYSAISDKLSQLKSPDTEIVRALEKLAQELPNQVQVEDLLTQTRSWTKEIEIALKKDAVGVYFGGIGPTIQAEGAYKEVAKIVPLLPSYAQPGVDTQVFEVKAPCGISNPHGNLIFAFCRNPRQEIAFEGRYQAVKLWSSSFQATTMAGRRFDKILKGRAQFRMGTEVAALVGAYAAMALLDAGLSGRNSDLQVAGLVVGAVALGTFLAGKTTNPEADLRQVTQNLESGYLLLAKEP